MYEPTGPILSLKQFQNQTRRGHSGKESSLSWRITRKTTNEQFRSLYEQHAQFKRQIEQIEAKPHVTEADELEEQRLKKLKLNLKDQMKQIMSQYGHTGVR